jgi:hypothetical protein
MRLYRGTDWEERRRRRYGFSWTVDKDSASGFAEGPKIDGHGGVILETLAPAAAILLVREKEDYYDEGEVVVDPFSLGRITVAERLPPPGALNCP